MSINDKSNSFRKLGAVIVGGFAVVALTTAPLKAIAQETRNHVAEKPQPGRVAAVDEDGAPELTERASQAIDKGLKHLLSIQKPDGSWDEGGEGRHDVGITSLGLMAFMAQAHFPGSGPYGKQLDRAKEFLLKKAKAGNDGYIGSVMYEHGLATLALSEMWGMTRNKEDDDAIQKALEAAVKEILRSQNEGGGWRYQPQVDAGQDTSVTVMIFVALASARQAGIVVPNETIKKVLVYLESAWIPDSGAFAYVPGGQGRKSSGGTVAATAGGAYAAQLAGQRDSEMVAGALRYLEKQSPGIFGNTEFYYYAHYYAIQAMVQAGDEQYAAWYPKIRDAMIGKQQPDGSWSKAKKGEAGGSYQTPMAIIILATPHRYIPIYQR